MIGRKKEKNRLLDAYSSENSEFVVVYGRRRVGKTFLVRETFNYKFTFSHTGRAKAGMSEQLLYFRDALVDAGYEACPNLKSWREAFRALQKFLEGASDARKVVFIDELPYMATHRSGFVGAFEHFWNAWASARKDIVLIVCGSAASWLLKKVIRDKGGLHNRVTMSIHLCPFALAECEQFAAAKGLAYTRSQIAECYMALGGIPYYWNCLRRGLGVDQNMDALFFSDGAELRHEYDELYTSLFDSPEPYMRIVEALGRSGGTLTRDEVVRLSGLASGGVFSRYLEDLEECGFVGKIKTFGLEKNGARYRLSDNFTLFHFNFIAHNTDNDETFWTDSRGSGMRRAWVGLAFERVCLAHVQEIKSALGIAGVRTAVSVWSHRADEVYPEGAQIDMVIDRADGIINLCEMKFTGNEFTVDKKYDRELMNKRAVFQSVTETKKAVHLTMVTSSGLVRNAYSNNIQSEVTLDDLFES